MSGLSMKKIVGVLVFFLLLSSCCKEESEDYKDSQGVLTKVPYIWKRSLHKTEGYSSNSYHKVLIEYNGYVGIPTTDASQENSRYLSMIDPDDGTTISEWNDVFIPQEGVNISYAHQHENLLFYQRGYRGYCINLETGATQWKIESEDPSFVVVDGIAEEFFVMSESENLYPQYAEKVGYRGNIYTGEKEEFLVPDFSLEFSYGNRIGDVVGIKPHMIDGVRHLVVAWQEFKHPINWVAQTYLGLFNYETMEWVYQKKEMIAPKMNGSVLSPLRIYDNMIFANIGHDLVCHDILSGEQLWTRNFPQDFMFSGFILEEGRLYGLNEDKILYCIDPYTGSSIWEEPGAGTSSPLTYMNGVLYFTGGSDGKLHAVDTETGETVWKLKGEHYDHGYFFNPVYVIPAKDGKPARIIAVNALNAYCIEAYR